MGEHRQSWCVGTDLQDAAGLGFGDEQRLAIVATKCQVGVADTCAGDDALQGLGDPGQLQQRGLVLEVWAYHTQLDEVLEVARAFPDLLIVVDHLGGPLGAGPYAGQRDAVFMQWSAGLCRLAQCPNVRLKLGGLGMKVAGFDYHLAPKPPSSVILAEQWRPYLLHAIDCFGVERCMFESNFPVDKGMFGYDVLWNAFKRVVTDFTEPEKNRLFSGTARETYQLMS